MARAELSAAVQIRSLRKSYGKLEAVRGIDLEIHAGEIFGIIGPDGAGKTSTFHVLGGIMPASSGSAEVYGVPAARARESVGYLTQSFSLYRDLTATENLDYIGALRRVSKADIAARGERYLTMFGIARFRNRFAGRLSGGMKQKLALACALVAEPRVLLLDEPTTGVDPVSRREFWDALSRLSAEGMTIVVATPYLDEAERCHRVALMHDGRIHKLGTPRSLRTELGLIRLEVRTADPRRAEDCLSQVPLLRDVQRFGDRLDVLVAGAVSGEAAVRDALAACGIGTVQIRAGAPTLENAFVSALRGNGKRAADRRFPARNGRSRPVGGAIRASHLDKRFDRFEAVKDVSLEIRHGEVYGLLGANGAGKTTTIKMLCGLLAPTRGGVELAGERHRLRSQAVRQRVGYMSQKFSLYDDLTVLQNLEFYAGVYGIPAGERDAKIRWVLEFSGLVGKERQLTASLPAGWKQRIAFGAAIMHEPDVLFLDEPTSGVDPIARRSFWRTINQLADKGTAILVTTHYLEEAEQCNRLGLMVAGRMAAEGSPGALKARQGGGVIELLCDDRQRALGVLKRSFEPWRVSLFGGRIHAIVDGDPGTEIQNLKRRLSEAGVAAIEASARELSLEDVFLRVVSAAGETGSADV